MILIILWLLLASAARVDRTPYLGTYVVVKVLQDQNAEESGHTFKGGNADSPSQLSKLLL